MPTSITPLLKDDETDVVRTFITKRLAENKKYRENMPSSHLMQIGMNSMIVPATEADGSQIQDITARAGVFSQEEIDSVPAMFDEYLRYGAEGSG